jgi:hypothetical protein
MERERFMVPRTEWGDGPWTEEPDRIEWRTLGLPCLIVRGYTGALCGYVGLPPTHRDYARHYDSVPTDHAHGGLTFAGYCSGHICHAPKAGETDLVWWLGFDCAHASDVSPAMQAYQRQHLPGYVADYLTGTLSGLWLESYKPVPYVAASVTALAYEMAARGPRNVSRERWWWWHVAQAKQFCLQDLPAMWKRIYLEQDRFGFSSEQWEAFGGRGR